MKRQNVIIKSSGAKLHSIICILTLLEKSKKQINKTKKIENPKSILPYLKTFLFDSSSLFFFTHIDPNRPNLSALV
jgi:hypothetical protein